MLNIDQIRTTALLTGSFFFVGLMGWRIIIYGAAGMSDFVFALVFGVLVGTLSYFFNKRRLGKK